MVIKRAQSFVFLVLTATLSASALSAASSEEARTRSFKLPGLVLMSPYQVPVEAGPLPNGADRAVPHQSFTSPQRIEQNSQPPNLNATAPGSDSTRYVPGTSVAEFNQTGAFTLGKLLVKPSGVIAYGYESNLQALNSGYQPDRSILILPTIEVFLPLTRNGIRLEYSMPYRHYARFDLYRGLDHILNADSEFDFSPILNLAIRNHFSIGSVDTREYVPGREVIFSDSPFRRNDLGVQLNWTLTENDSLGFKAGWNHVLFEQPPTGENPPFYGYNQYGFAGTYKRDLSERFGLIAQAGYRNNSTGDPRKISDSNGVEILGGIEGSITPLIRGQFSIGGIWDRYPGAVKNSAAGMVLRGTFLKEISERSQVTLALSRASNLSYFQENPYYITTGIGGTYTRELGPRLLLSFSPGYQRNSYPLPLQAGPGIPDNLVGNSNRWDSFVDMDLGVRYRYNDWLALDMRFNISRRNSDIPDFRFKSYRAGINLLIGSKGSAVGRSPF